MMKFLLLLAVIAGVWWFALRRDTHRKAPPAAAAAPRLQNMVRCAHCGVHLPEGEAVGDGERLYCSEVHRALGQRAS